MIKIVIDICAAILASNGFSSGTSSTTFHLKSNNRLLLELKSSIIFVAFVWQTMKMNWKMFEIKLWKREMDKKKQKDLKETEKEREREANGNQKRKKERQKNCIDF